MKILKLLILNPLMRFFYEFFRRLTNTVVGSYLFCYIILRRGFGKYYLDFLTGNNIKNLIINSINILAAKKLKKYSTNSLSIEDLVKLGFSFQFSYSFPKFNFNYKISLKTFQNKFEIIKFLKLIKKIEPKIILEIGTAMGGTLFLLSRISDFKATLISVDLLNGKIGGDKKSTFFRNFAQNRQKIRIIKGDSHKLSTFQNIKKILKNRKVDLLFIDGDHTYSGVKEDFEKYKVLVKNGGLICLHDIVPGPYDNVGGVPDFWREIQENYDTYEIVENWNQGGYGIGIVFIR